MENEYTERISRSFRELASCLSQEDPAVMQQLARIRDHVAQLSCVVHQYDYADVKGNGFRVGIEYVIRLFEYGGRKFSSGSRSGGKADSAFRNMVSLFDAGAVYFQQLREATKSSGSLIDPSVDILSSGFTEYFDRNGMDAGFGPMTGFFLPSPESRVAYFFYLAIGLVAAGSVTSALRTLVDWRARRDSIRREFNHMRVEHLKWIDVFGDSWYVRKVTPVTTFGWLRPAVRRTVYVPRQERYKLLCDVDQQSCDLVEHESLIANSRRLKCRLQLDTRETTAGSGTAGGTVLLHVHGGGFVMGSAENHECYNRAWVLALPGVAMLSVHYDLSPESQFPVAVQQILDAFLFLQTDQARHVIGYRPRRVLLIGDSSGALMSAAVTVVLNDLRAKFESARSRIWMPLGILAIYPSFMCVPFTTPALLLSALHPELPFPAFLTMISAYVPFRDQRLNNVIRSGYQSDKISRLQVFWDWLTGKQDDSNNNSNNNNNNSTSNQDNKNQEEDGLVKEEGSVREDIWWNQSAEQTLARMQEWKLIKHPYVSPLLHPDLGSLTTVKLSIFAVDTDPILDHAVEISKRWGGPVRLTIWDDVIHAFLPLVGAGGKYEQHNREIIDEIKRMIGYED